MGKYAPLGEFLRAQRASFVPMTFEDIECITGVKLPPKAQHHRAWWSNNPSNNVMTKVWLDAGYETEQVDIARRRLVFRRVQAPSKVTPPWPMPGTISETKSHHPLRGALKGLVHIAPGTDLTEPAEPHWGD